MGLNELADSQNNSIELSLSSSNTVKDIVKLLENGDRFLSAILNSAKLEIKANLNKELGTKVRDVIANFD